MDLRSTLKTRQVMAKCKRQDGPANRSTRAFVASQNRKISRKSGVEKKRGIPLMDTSSIDENEAQNCQDQNKIVKDAKNEKKVDPIKEALKKWQKDKRLRQIQEKKTKREPFRISTVSHRASEYSHSYLNASNEVNTAKNKQMVPPPLKNTETSRKAKPAGGAGQNTLKIAMNNCRPGRISSRTMKTRSMTRQIPAVTNMSKSTTQSVPMETDNIVQKMCTGKLTSPLQARPCANKATPAIPNSFAFNVPVGVDSFVFCGDQFQFQPLSPTSAKKFLPTVSLPVETTYRKEAPLNSERRNCDKHNNIPTQPGACVENSAPEMVDVCKAETQKHELDSKHFRNLANSEIDRLKSRSAHWKSEDIESLPEDVKGMIRTVIGQVQLLVTKKFKQFSGLLDLSENPAAEKKALVSDLQGFWDMMNIQVEDINRKFTELEELKANNWEAKNTNVAVKKITKKTAKVKKTSKSANSEKLSENRNKFREMRAQMKAKLQTEKKEEQNAFQIVLTPMKNKNADADPSEPEIILTPVRRSARKSRGPCSGSIPISLVDFPNVPVDLFGACKTPSCVPSDDCLSNLEDSIFRRRHLTPAAKFSATDDLMAFSPMT